MDERQQQQMPGMPYYGGTPFMPGFPGTPTFPGTPGFPSGSLERRVDRLERITERQQQQINNLNRRLQRVERQLGFPFSSDF